jgi:hypothetical protein
MPRAGNFHFFYQGICPFNRKAGAATRAVRKNNDVLSWNIDAIFL